MTFKNAINGVLNFKLADVVHAARAVSKTFAEAVGAIHDHARRFTQREIEKASQLGGFTGKVAGAANIFLGIAGGSAITATGLVLAVTATYLAVIAAGALIGATTLVAGGLPFLGFIVSGIGMAAAVAGVAAGSGCAVQAQRQFYTSATEKTSVPTIAVIVPSDATLDANASSKAPFGKVAVCDMGPNHKNKNPGTLDPASNPHPGIYAPGPHMGD